LNLQVAKSVTKPPAPGLVKRIRAYPLARAIFKRYVPSPLKDIVRTTFLSSEESINQYFIKYIYSHEAINAFAARRGRIPLLQPSPGCSADIDELIGRRFTGKKIVSFHLGTAIAVMFVWTVAFVALGRLQEKPLEFLRLPNVTSLRIFGLGLNHELTFMLRSDLFIGTSSGFAAMANFSALPYFITHMNPGSCEAYAIPEGAERLPFAARNQKLVYARETSELLMSLLQSGLQLQSAWSRKLSTNSGAVKSEELDINGWLNSRLQVMNSAATSSRFFVDDNYRDSETAFLLFLSLDRVKEATLAGAREKARETLAKIERNFPELCRSLPQYMALKEVVEESVDGKFAISEAARARLESLTFQVAGFVGVACSDEMATTTGWRSLNWDVVGSEFRPLAGEAQTALALRSKGGNAYWHSESFVCSQADGRIILCFDAKNSSSPSLHQVYIFQDSKYHQVGEVFAETEWRRFEVPISTNPGSVLELQIDQRDTSQWLSIRDLHVFNGGPIPLLFRTAVAIPSVGWFTAGAPGKSCGGDCWQWPIAGKGFIKSPQLPSPGERGLMICFEARTDRLSKSFTSIYLFEGKEYRTVAHYLFTPNWTEYAVVLAPERGASIEMQIDFPDSVEWLWVRDVRAVPVDAVKGSGVPNGALRSK
jgi:hypothetical protein